jgi:hypothetical protein
MKSDFALPPWEQQPEQAINPEHPILNPKNIKGLWIPAKYLFAKNLNMQERVLMGFIYMLDQKDHCYASDKYLGELISLSAKTISNMVRLLKKKNYLKLVSWNGRVRVLKCI